MKNMETKKQIRQRLRQQRESLSSEQGSKLSAEICRKLRARPWFSGARTICFYYPLGNEVNLLPLAEEALTLGKRIAFPRVEGKEMEFYEAASLEDFQEGSFHVMEPVSQIPAAEPGMTVLVPGLGFDRRGNRMGYGGGYYDRYFARRRECMKIGIAYQFQFVEELAAEAHDIPMDEVITERAVWTFLL